MRDMFAFLVTVFPYFSKSYNYETQMPFDIRLDSQKTSSIETGSPNAEKHGNSFFCCDFMIGRIFLNYLQPRRNVCKKWKPRTLNLWCAYLYIYSRKKLQIIRVVLLHTWSTPMALEEYKFLRFQTHCPKNRPLVKNLKSPRSMQ